MRKKKDHKVKTSTQGYVTECRNKNIGYWKPKATTDWRKVTCKRCLKRKPKRKN